MSVYRGSTQWRLDQLAKPTFRSRYAHTKNSEGPMDTVSSKWRQTRVVGVQWSYMQPHGNLYIYF